jgi:predicted Zn-dependent peptidase
LALALAVVAITGGARADPSAGTPSTAGATRAAGDVEQPPATRFRLPNGLDVVLQPNRRQPQVAVLVAYDVGHRDAPPGYEQLAHLVEHMSYRASRHLGPLEGWAALRAAGAHHQHGLTGTDMTVYETVLPSAALATALWVESERMAFSLERFDQQALDIERRIVESERRLREGWHDAFQRNLFVAMYGADHPYAADIWAADLNAIKLSHVQGFFQRGYRPDNARLVVTGDFDAAAAKDLIQKYFGSIVGPRGAVPRAPLERRAQFVSHALVFEHPLVTVQTLVLAWPAPRAFAPGTAALDVFSHVLTNRLEKRLVKQDGLARAVERRFQYHGAGAALLVEIDLADSAHRSDVEDAVVDEWARTWRGDWARALGSAKQRAVLSFLRSLEQPLWQAYEHLAAVLFQETPFDASKRLNEYRSLTTKDMVALQAHFRDHQWLVAWCLRPDPWVETPDSGRLVIE